jgi:enamine deaminase RidA (YjgF/YER057c/UK114 family)
MIPIERLGVNARMSTVVIANNVLYMKGVVPSGSGGETIQSQVTDVLGQIEMTLKDAGLSLERLLTVSIWLADIKDVAALNEIYDKWVVPGHQPVRACVEAALGQPHWKVEVQVTAAR